MVFTERNNAGLYVCELKRESDGPLKDPRFSTLPVRLTIKIFRCVHFFCFKKAWGFDNINNIEQYNSITEYICKDYVTTTSNIVNK